MYYIIVLSLYALCVILSLTAIAIDLKKSKVGFTVAELIVLFIWAFIPVLNIPLAIATLEYIYETPFIHKIMNKTVGGKK